MSKVISYRSLGVQQACDIQVDHPDHQFYLANGLLTSNSHAVAYSGISIFQCWQKAHFAPEFWASKLQFGGTNPEDKESVWAIRNKMMVEGNKFARISCNTCGPTIRIGKNGKFYWRLDLIKWVSSAAAALIKKCAKYTGPIDMITRISAYYKKLREKAEASGTPISKICPVNKRVITALIVAGTFDDVCHDGDRFQIGLEYMAYYYKKKWKDLARYVDYEEIPEAHKMSMAQHKDVLWLRSLADPLASVVMQQEYLRFVSRPYWKIFREHIPGLRAGDVALMVQRMTPGTLAQVYGTFSSLKIRNSKIGKILTGTIDEYDGSVSFVMFAKALARQREIVDGLLERTSRLGWIRGTVKIDSYRGGKQIIVDMIGDLAPIVD